MDVLNVIVLGLLAGSAFAALLLNRFDRAANIIGAGGCIAALLLKLFVAVQVSHLPRVYSALLSPHPRPCKVIDPHKEAQHGQWFRHLETLVLTSKLSLCFISYSITTL